MLHIFCCVVSYYIEHCDVLLKHATILKSTRYFSMKLWEGKKRKREKQQERKDEQKEYFFFIKNICNVYDNVI